ncbi:hypothetical protein GC163_21295 [bacterium]|nr:hypothetical protein [bacterium]
MSLPLAQISANWSPLLILGALLWWGLALCPVVAYGQNAKRLNISDKGLDYYGPETNNPFATLLDRVAAGEVSLEYHPEQGYLPALLRELQIPVESQLLLFSKSSLQSGHIGPKSPRALYFNDEICLGWIPDAPLIELMAQDPVKGSMFYAIPQDESGFHASREQRCNGCHATSRSAYVPGFLLRSFETNSRGGLVSGRAKVTQATPIDVRWGGWYITGESPSQPHRGNLVSAEDHAQHRDQPLFRGALPDLSPLVDLQIYPHPNSDLAAAMLMDHFSDTYNLLVRAGTEARLGEEVTVIDDLVTALLCLDEAPLLGPVKGVGGFSTAYEKLGPADSKGRSLREFDLQTRLFRWGMSPMVYTPTFQQLPDAVRLDVDRQITALLTGETPWPESAPARSKADREVALSILRETLSEWTR